MGAQPDHDAIEIADDGIVIIDFTRAANGLMISE